MARVRRRRIATTGRAIEFRGLSFRSQFRTSPGNPDISLTDSPCRGITPLSDISEEEGATFSPLPLAVYNGRRGCLAMPWTEAPGFRMYYEEHGAGFPLLLINGLGSDHLEWVHQIPVFSKSFRVVVFDNRGTGRSGVPPGPYTTAQMADDVAASLRFLGIGRAHVLGVSLGGMIAQEVALRHRDRVDRLVLGCTGPGGNLSLRPSPEAMAVFALAK